MYFKISNDEDISKKYFNTSSVESFKETLFIHLKLCHIRFMNFEYFQWADSKKHKYFFSFLWVMIQLFPAFTWPNKKLWEDFILFYLCSHLTATTWSPTISNLQSLFWFQIFFYLVIKYWESLRWELLSEKQLKKVSNWMMLPYKVLRSVDWHYFSLYSTFMCPRSILFGPHFYL